MAKEKNYLVHLHYRLVRDRRNENPKKKELITWIETSDTILPFSAKDDDTARELVKEWTSTEGARKGSSVIFVKGLWQVGRRVPLEK